MKVTILHLSDIHVHGPADYILSQAREIASTVFSCAIDSDACLIVVTGDIAFSGDRDEYDCANVLLQSIRSAIKNEGCRLVDVIVVPGNHDCKLIPEDSVRSILIEKILSDPSFATDPAIVEACTRSQQAFSAFRKAITSTPPLLSHPLWTEYELSISGRILRLSALNASWMSRIPEVPGQLVYPIEQFQEQLAQASALRIVLLHHPLNWYSQSSYHPLRKALRTHADIILSGHEHTASSGAIYETIDSDNLYYESGALQPENVDEPSTYGLLVFDTEANLASESRFEFRDGRLTKTLDGSVREIRKSNSRRAGELDLTKVFLDQLNDPGGNFTHPEKSKIDLDDVFVYPDVRELRADIETDMTSPADSVLFRDHQGQRLLLLADEKAGKSILLLRAFREYHSRGLLPLYIQSGEITSVSQSELAKAISRCAATQYVHVESLNRASVKQKIALVDDIDRLRGNAAALASFISYLENHFSAVILTATSGFEFSELLSKDAAAALLSYSTFEILPFGYRLRLQLIRKWCLCGSVSTTKLLDKRVHDIERIVSAVVGKSLVPSQPIYLLILLQSCQQQQQSELQNSGFSYYYQYLITKSLKEAGIKPDELNELFNYLSNLAWLYRRSDVSEISIAEMRQFNNTFSEKFVSVDLSQRLGLLCNARILHVRGDHYSFTYPYVFYYFVGKYLADNLEGEEVRSVVGLWCSNLHRSANANSILFLTHHRSDAWVIERIADVVRQCFFDYTPMTFDGDLAAINALVDSASQLLISEIDVSRNQEEERALRDRYESEETEESGLLTNQVPHQDTPQLLDFVARMTLLLRTSEILGQILKNYYGSLTRQVKSELLQETIEGPLRMLRALMEGIADDPEVLVKELELVLKKQGRVSDSDRDREKVRRMTFQILGAMCTGMVARTAQFIGAEKLDDDVAVLVDRKRLNSYRLVEAATWLTRAGALPLERIRRLAADLEHNVFAFSLLQSLAAYHLHLFHTDDREKQKLCAHLNISMARSRAIDMQTSGTKILAKRRKRPRGTQRKK